ncbi:hypothetical protein H0H93_012521 [Arthromyces matolae]|nr:hypothetical protein H0H93_012521 [Arthromyces matolae]
MFSIAQRVQPFVRSASTQATPRGLAAILQKNPHDVVITFAKRTPVGRAKKGQFKDVPVDEILHALFKASTCHPPSPLYLSRAAALAAGIPHHVPISTVNRLCSSGLMAIRTIAHSIQAGEASLGLAIGVESMSLNPRPTPEVCEVVDKNPEAHDCIQPMGWTSEMVAETYKVSRQKQDEYALISHERANKALSSGVFQDEIIPIDIKGNIHTKDDTIRPNVSAESLASLKPVFPDWGQASTTAGNASGVGDGAAICILTTRERAQREGLSIIGKWVGSAITGVEPRYMGISPIFAVPKVLSQLDLTKDDIDVFEASAQAGVRQVVTGLAELERTGGKLLCTIPLALVVASQANPPSLNMSAQISKKRKFVADGVFRAELNEFFTRELAEEGYSGCDVRVTHARTELRSAKLLNSIQPKIIIRATHTQEVLGEKGRRIRELTALVQKRFKFPENSLELYAEKVQYRGLSAIAQCESLRYKLLGGLAVRRACYGVLRFVMESGAKGCEVVVSGKLRAARAKSMKFTDGFMLHSGQPARDFVDYAVRHVLLKQGVLGIKVKMYDFRLHRWQDASDNWLFSMKGSDPEGLTGPRQPLPDSVQIFEPPVDKVVSEPSSEQKEPISFPVAAPAEENFASQETHQPPTDGYPEQPVF